MKLAESPTQQQQSYSTHNTHTHLQCQSVSLPNLRVSSFFFLLSLLKERVGSFGKNSFKHKAKKKKKKKKKKSSIPDRHIVVVTFSYRFVTHKLGSLQYSAR
jgi:hypothetical protein